jgi:cytoskeletal protein CcmA (bactofilin family)
MVFSRKPDSTPSQPAAEVAMPQFRRNERTSQVHSAQFGSTPVQPESVIGNDLTIEGQTITIRCKGSLRVNGNIQADLHSRTLEVGSEAQIQGAIAADTVNVYGRVNGAILGTKVVLHASAEVEGDIHSQYLSIEQGASFDGRSRKVNNPAEIAPQLERQSPLPGGGVVHSHETKPQTFGSLGKVN